MLQEFLKIKICSIFLLFITGVGFGQVAQDKGSMAYQGEVEVQYMLLERFIVLKRKGTIEESENGYVLNKGRGKDTSYLVHTDLEDAVRKRSEKVSGEKIYILYYNEDTPDPEALMKKYDVGEIPLSSSDISEAPRKVRVQKGKVRPIK